MANQEGAEHQMSVHIEQYQSYLQDVGNIGVRHENSRNYYLSVVSALFVFLSMAGADGPFQMVKGRVLTLVALVGILLCVVWGIHMQAFRALYAAKFGVLREIEKEPGFFPIFAKEYELLKANSRYIFLTLIDTLTPVLFVGLFGTILYLK